MNKPPRTRLQPAEREQQLVDVAERLFEALPYDDVTMEAIAAEAGVSPALVHHYFGAKRDVLLAVVVRNVIGFTDALAPSGGGPRAADKAPAERLRATFERYLDYVSEHPNGYSFLIDGGGAHDPEIRRLVAGTRAAAHQVVLASVGLERPTTEQDVQAWGWIGFVEATVTRGLHDRAPDRATLIRIVMDAAEATFLNGTA